MRLVHELQTNPQGCFLTLTYDDEHLPVFSDGLPTLWKDDLQRFFKRFRKYTGCKIKYYAVGEYGETTYRPHYHAVVYGWMPPTKKLIPSQGGFTHDDITDIWSHGSIQIGSVTNDSIYYVAGYLLKSLLFKKNIGSRTLPFLRTSKGLGLDYFNIHSDRVADLSITAEGKKSPLPRYYCKKLGHPVDSSSLVADSYSRQVALLRRLLASKADLPSSIRSQALTLVSLARLQAEKDVKALKERLRGKRYKV